MPPLNRRATVRLSFDCNNACVFCGQDSLSGTAEHDRGHLAKLREEHDEITFVGGEPTLDPRLAKAIETARELDYSAVGVQTNGRRLSEDPKLLATLVSAGLSDLNLSIHGPGAATHDYHTGVAGSFAAISSLLTHATKAGLTIVISTVVTRSNFRELPKMPSALKRRGVAAWLLEALRPYGRAAGNFARVVPRFGMALPWALHALEQARRQALSAWIHGAPLCGLGPFAASALACEPRSYGPPCQGCPAQPRCPGVDPAYLEVFGHGELKAGPARALADFDRGRTRLMRMFVGIGELVARPPQLTSPVDPADPADPSDRSTPSSKNRRLPVLASDARDQAYSGSNE